jgi:hypothetical protein
MSTEIPPFNLYEYKHSSESDEIRFENKWTSRLYIDFLCQAKDAIRQLQSKVSVYLYGFNQDLAMHCFPDNIEPTRKKILTIIAKKITTGTPQLLFDFTYKIENPTEFCISWSEPYILK